MEDSRLKPDRCRSVREEFDKRPALSAVRVVSECVDDDIGIEQPINLGGF